MDTSILIPGHLWDGDQQCVLTNWLASHGGRVQAGSPIVELMVEKTQFELAAPATGVLSIEAPVDTILSKGDLIGLIR